MASFSTTTASPELPKFLTQSKSELKAKFVDLEWQQRNRLLQGTQQPISNPSEWSRITGDATVTARNRYANVEPFALNRIKLKVSNGANDYINASPIQLSKRRYIATQGPKAENVNHFYRMLAGELKSPAVVVMLTQTHESGKEKCFNYFDSGHGGSPLVVPEDRQMNDGFQGTVQLIGVENHAKSRTELRKLRLKARWHNGESVEREIYHLLFSGWPDFLVPEGEDRNALIELVRLSAQLNRAPSTETATQTNGSSFAEDIASTDQDNPRIIHCSAGVGRSGTFIALDYLLSLLHSGQLDNLSPDEDPIAEAVDELRKQRMMMVQGEGQFLFLYEVLREQFVLRASGALHTNGGAEASLTR